jgi:hypothetical protein
LDFQLEKESSRQRPLTNHTPKQKPMLLLKILPKERQPTINSLPSESDDVVIFLAQRGTGGTNRWNNMMK